MEPIGFSTKVDHFQPISDLFDNVVQVYLPNDRLVIEDIGDLVHLRTISRIHGLPSQLIPHLLSYLVSTQLTQHKIVICQILKYAIKAENLSNGDLSNVVSKLLPILSSDSMNSADEDSLYQIELCLVLCRIHTRDPTVITNNSILSDIVTRIIGNDKIQLRESVKNELEQFLDTCKWQDDEEKKENTLENGQLDDLTAFEGYIPPATSVPLYTAGGFGRFKSTNKVKQQAHAVKVQQQTTSQVTQLESEETELAQLSLAKALSARSRSIQTTSHREVLPDEAAPKEGSETYWYQTTYYKVNTILETSKYKVISQPDQDYLISCLEGSHVTFAYRATTHLMLAEAFFNASKRQRLTTANFKLLLDSVTKSEEEKSDEYTTFVLQTVQNCCIRDESFFKNSHDYDVQTKLSCFLGSSTCKDQHKDIILELFAQMSNCSDPTKEVFDLHLNNLVSLDVEEDSKKKSTAVRYICLQSMKEKQVRNWFSRDVVADLCRIAIHRKSSAKFTGEVLEILENYLDQPIVEACLSVQDFVLSLISLADKEENEGFSLVVLRLAIKCLHKKVSPEDRLLLLEALITMNWLGSLEIKTMVLVQLWQESSVLAVPKAHLLAPLLLKDDKAASAMVEDDCQPENGQPLSAIVASILINSWSKSWLSGQSNGSSVIPSSLVATLIEALEDNRDVQTRIRCAKLLHEIVDREEELALSEIQLKSVHDLTSDTCVDVRLLAKYILAKGSLHLSRKNDNIGLDTELLAFVAYQFGLDSLIQDGVDVSARINQAVISTICAEAKKEKTVFESEVWSLVALVLDSAQAAGRGEIYLNQVLDSILAYTKTGKVLPIQVMSRLEVYLGNSENTAKVESIFASLIEFGHLVSDNVLAYFCGHMTQNIDIQHKIPYQLLLKANLTHDLDQKTFSLLWLESCLLFLQQKTSQRQKFAWTQVEKLLTVGFPLSVLGIQIFESITNITFLSSYLKCLTLMAENHQGISKVILDEIRKNIRHFGPLLHSLTEFCSCLLQNNQEIPDEIVHFVFAGFEDKSNEIDFGTMLRFIQFWMEKSCGNLSETLLNILVYNFQRNELDILRMSALLNILVSVADDANANILLSAFFSTFQNSALNHLIPIAIEGICKCAETSELNSDQLQLLVDSMGQLEDSASQQIYDILQHATDGTKLSKEQQRKLTMAGVMATTNNLAFLAKLKQESVKDVGFIGSIDSKCIEKLIKMIEGNARNLVVSALEIALQWIECKNVNASCALKQRFVTCVINLLLQSQSNGNVHTICVKILDKNEWIDGNFFTVDLIHKLESAYPLTKFIFTRFPSDRLSPKMELLLSLDSIESTSNTDLSQIVDKLRHLSNSADDKLQISRDHLKFLISKCKSDDLSAKVSDLLLFLLSKCEIELDEEIAEFLLRVLSRDNQIFDVKTCKVISRIIQSNRSLNEKQVECILANLVHTFNTCDNFPTKKTVLITFSTCLANDKINVVPEEMMEILESNLYSDESSIRRICFQALTSEAITKRTSSAIGEFIVATCLELLKSLPAEGHAHAFFTDCHQEQVIGQLDRNKLDLFETLISLDFVDKIVLESNSVEDWKIQFVILDFIFHFNPNQHNKIIWYEIVQNFGNKFGWTLQVYNILFWLRDEAQGNCESAEIFDILQLLSTLTIDQVQDLMGKCYSDWTKEVERLILIDELAMRTGLDGTNEGIISIVTLLHDQLKFHQSLAMLKCVRQVKNLDNLELLLSFIRTNHKQPENLFGSSVWINIRNDIVDDEHILIALVEKATLINCLQSTLQSAQHVSKLDLSRCGNHVVSLYDSGLSFDQLQSLIKLKDNFTAFESQELMQVLSLLVDHKPNASVVSRIIDKLVTCDWTTWVVDASRIIHSSQFVQGSTLKTADEIVEELFSNSDDVEDKTRILMEVIRVVSLGNLQSTLCPDISMEIAIWTTKHIRTWSDKVKSLFQSGHQQVNEEFCMESLSVAKRAFELHTNFQLTNIQIVSIYRGLNKGLSGALFQIATGSGKSTIVAILSVLNALRNLNVDVYTSSPVLAERDAKSWSPFYAMFGLSCSHNADIGIYVNGLKQCYKANVVYGEIAQFQFDILRHGYSELGTMGNRTLDFAIVDEVDSLLLDDMAKLARLSSPIPGNDVLQILYHLLWERMLTMEKKLFTVQTHIYYVEGQINLGSGVPCLTFKDTSTGQMMEVEDLVGYIQLGQNLDKVGIYPIGDIDEFVRRHLQDYVRSTVGLENATSTKVTDKNPLVRIPSHLVGFVAEQIHRWVDNCILAYNYRPNIEYIVESGQIKPVDYLTTGIVQGGTSWSDGLHQFLQLKHNLKLTSESFTTNFLSNMSLFQKYVRKMKFGGFVGNNLVGLTGTLGSDETRRVLGDLYKCRSVNIPKQHHERYVQYPDIVLSHQSTWEKEVVAAVKAQIARSRGTLVICETIESAHHVADLIRRGCKLNNGVKLYTHNNANQEQHVERILPKQIIIATNLAGRGTDINTKEIEEFGGLHVCLTFLPRNSRVEEQAFGRTSRQGNYGSGQLVCLLPEFLIQSNSTIAENIRPTRDQLEDQKLTSFLQDDYQILDARDACFGRFSTLIRQARSVLRREQAGFLRKMAASAQVKSKSAIGFETPEEEKCHLYSSVALSTKDVVLLKALEERWALFLRRIGDGNIAADQAMDYYKVFQARVKWNFNFNKGTHSKVVQSPFYHVAIGNDYLMAKNVFTAQQHFEAAIKLDPSFAVGAHVGLGNILLNKAKDDTNYKSKAIVHFTKAMELIQVEISQLTMAQTLLNGRSKDEDSALSAQLTTKMNILGSYSNCVDQAIDVAKRSLRPISIHAQSTKSDDEIHLNYFHIKDFTDNVQSTTIGKISELSRDFDIFTLKLNNLTCYSDATTVDQAIQTMQQIKLPVVLECPNVTWDTLASFACQNVYLNNVTTKEALIAVEGWTNKTSALKRFVGWTNDKIEILHGDKSIKKDLSVKSAKEFLDKQNSDKIFNLISHKANEKSFGIFSKAKMDFNLFDLGIEDAELLLSFITSNLESMTMRVHTSTLEESGVIIPKEANVQVISHKTDGRKTVTNLDDWSGQENDENWHEFRLSGDEDFLPCANRIIQTLIKNLDKDKKSSSSGIRLSLSFKSIKPSLIETHQTTFERILQSASANVQFRFDEETDKEFWMRRKLREAKAEIKKRVHKTTKEEDVIAQLREFNVEFSLNFECLCVSDAIDVIQKAVIDQEKTEVKKTKVLPEIFLSLDAVLIELAEFNGRGIFLIFEFNERGFVPWFSIICVGVIGVTQMVVGGVLICTGFGATLGMGLITEGAADIFTAYRAYANRQFSWKDYAIQKAISLTISACSMGLSSLKDAAKGATLLVESAGKEIVEQAASKLIVEGAKGTLSVTIKAAGSNLKKLAFKQVMVSLGEATLREVGNYGMDQLGKFTMTQIEPQIRQVVKKELDQNLHSKSNLHQLICLLHVVNKKQLESKMMKVVNEMISGSAWAKFWHSVGLPLVKGVFSNSKYFLANVVAQAARILTLLNGIREIATAVEIVCAEILKSLQKVDLSPGKLLQSYNKMDPSEAMEQGKLIGTSEKEGRLVFVLSSSSALSSTTKKFFTDVNEGQKKFEMQEIELTLAKVVELLVGHIVRISESQLLAPVSSWAVGKMVSFTSTFMQEAIEGQTVDQQIRDTAKEFTIAWAQRENLVEILKMEAEAVVNSGPVSQSVKDKAQSIVAGGPIDMSTLVALAEKMKLNVRIVGPDYIPTAEDVASGVKLIVFIRGHVDPATGVAGIGHFSTMDTETGETSEIRSLAGGQNDCALEVLASFSPEPVSPDELRLAAAKLMIEKAASFEKVIEREKWIQDRHPEEARIHLLVGGAQRQSRREQKVMLKRRSLSLNATGRKTDEETTVETVDMAIPSDQQGARRSDVSPEIRADRIAFEGVPDLINGHILHHGLGGSGSDPLNIMPITTSMNRFFYCNFEKYALKIKNTFSHISFNFNFRVERTSRHGLTDSLSVNFGLDFSRTTMTEEHYQVQREFDSTFTNATVGQRPVYTRNANGSYQTTIYHNPTGRAGLDRDPNAQYRPPTQDSHSEE